MQDGGKSPREVHSVDTQSASNLFESLVDFRGHGASQRPRKSSRHSLAWAGQAHVQGSLLDIQSAGPARATPKEEQALNSQEKASGKEGLAPKTQAGMEE